MNRKLSTHLLILADDDDFETSLYILLSKSSQLNLSRRTISGDYLVTLAAYAACETTLYLGTRIKALKCLILVLERDFTAVNKIAADGGSALHCALSAAASSCLNEYDSNDSNEDDHDEEEDESDDDSSVENEDEDDDDGRDKVFMNELISEAKSNVVTGKYYPELDSLSSTEIIALTIHVLIANDADLNLPLANVHNLTNGKPDEEGGDDDDDDDDEELELAYSKESIIQQWTPLMFASQIVTLACKKNEDTSIALSIFIFQLLLDTGADPSYMMGSTTQEYNWNALEVLGSSCNILSEIEMNEQCIESLQILCNSSLRYLNMLQQQDRTILKLNLTIEKTVFDSLQSSITVHKYDGLTPLQDFAIAIMTNNIERATLILELKCESQSIGKDCQLRKWRSVLFSRIFPILQSSWDIDYFSSKSLLSITSYCLSVDASNLLLGGDYVNSSEKEMRENIQSVFLSCSNSDLNQNQVLMLSSLLGLERDSQSLTTNFLKKRQRVLDRLLIESCSNAYWAQQANHSTLALLLLGADSMIRSIADEVSYSLTPLHLVAGNYRGHDGVYKAESLLGKFQEMKCLKKYPDSILCADLYATASRPTNAIPLDIALEKKNHHVIMKLYEEMSMGSSDANAIDRWNMEKASNLGYAAIACSSISLFQSAIHIMKDCVSGNHDANANSVLSSHIGKLLSWAFDERSGLCQKQMSSEKLKEVLQIVTDVQVEMSDINIPVWAKNEVSGYTPLHSMLKPEVPVSIRISLLLPLCTFLSRNPRSISLPCSDKFGSYTPLHFACALGCEESVNTLLEFNADPTVECVGNRRPIDLLPDCKAFINNSTLIQLQSTNCTNMK